MSYFRKFTHWMSVIVLLNLGIEGIFDINLIDRALVNFHVVHQLFQISCLFAGALMMLCPPVQ